MLLPSIGLDSCSYHLHFEDVDHPRDTLWFLRRVVDLALSGCSFSPGHLRAWDEETLHRIGDFCDQHNLYLQLTSSASDYARLCRRLILASEVGASMLQTCITQISPSVSEVQRRVHIRFAVENLKRLGEVAECVRVVLGISNRCGLTTTELADVIEQVNSPFVRVSFCSAEVLASWEDPVEAAVAIAPHVAGITLKDCRVYRVGPDVVYESCELGKGEARVADVYRVLRRSCPQAPLTLKLSGDASRTLYSLEDEDAHVRESIQFIRALDPDRVLV